METRTKLTGLALALAVAGSFLPAQEAAVATFETAHFRIEYPSGLAGAEEAFAAFEAIRSAFDETFLFGEPEAPGTVKVCADKAAFDAYVSSVIGETRNQYLFLKYSDPAASRLVLYPAPGKSGYAAFAGPALNRQLLLQYLYARVSEPPLWIREGFQAYFENLGYDPATGTVTTGAYSPWLETAKTLAADPARALSPKDLVSARTGRYDSAVFYPQAWALVRFFLTTEMPEYQRFLHESFVLLDRVDGSYNADSQADNTALLAARFARIFPADAAKSDYTGWLSAMLTYNQMLQAGMDAYSSGSYDKARAAFAEAWRVHPEDPMLLYYRGLTEYAAKDYAAADGWYRQALKAGAEVSTVNWALGLNAVADGRNGEARVYLETAKSANPARYGEKADRILNSMPK